MTTNGNSKIYNVPPQETWPKQYNHINGSMEEFYARTCITELCKGWPVYRDFSEWDNYRSLFTDDGVVFTTWAGGLHIDKFIEVSKAGRSKGDFIAHRENGTLADVNLSKGRGVGKMKATITQRFVIDGNEFDIDCDCRFIFFCKLTDQGWKAKWVKLFYEKDKVVPIDGKSVPTFSAAELNKYTQGYQYLAACQNRIAGHEILNDLPNANNQGFHDMYKAMNEWIEGGEPDLYKV